MRFPLENDFPVGPLLNMSFPGGRLVTIAAITRMLRARRAADHGADGGGGYDEGIATETITEDDVNEALEEVIDPELGLDFVSLGLVYDVEIEGGEVFITFTLTTPACPIGPQVSEQMKEFVGELPGVEKVHPKMVFDPPWSPEMMTEDAKFALGF
jgi:metal-sulfur cluster biosynthetic enzyme